MSTLVATLIRRLAKFTKHVLEKDGEELSVTEPPATGVLGPAAIDARHDEIFASGFASTSLQRSSYDLRIATTKMILPDGTRIPEGEEYSKSFRISPGEVALVSTLERITMPIDLCGAVSIKFTYASRGILVLMGMIVDPGYGSDLPEGRRLHFVLANVGSELIVIRPGEDRVAALQLFVVHGYQGGLDHQQGDGYRGVEPPKSPALIDELFNDERKSLGLSFFESQSNIRSRVEKLETQVDEHVRGLNQIVLFGHFLLGTAVLGVIITLVLGWTSDNTMTSRIQTAIELLPDTGWRSACFVAALITLFVIIPRLLTSIVKQISKLLASRRI